jgi:hypothetical protein
MDKDVNVYDYTLIINENEHIKTLPYDKQLTLKQRLNYDIVYNNTANIQFIPNPIIKNEYKIFNIILKYIFIDCSFNDKLELISLLRININKYFDSYIYNYIYQITVNSNFDIDIMVRLFDYPIDLEYFKSNRLDKVIIELKNKIYEILIQNYEDKFKDKFIIEKSNIINPDYLYPFIRPASLMEVSINQQFVIDKFCVLLENTLDAIMSYYDLETLNDKKQDIQNKNPLYNINNKKTQNITVLIQYWNNIIIKVLSESKYKDKDKNGYDNKLTSYIPLLVDKKSNDFILGLTSNSVNNKMILTKISNDFRVKLLTYNNINYLSTYNFLTIMNDNSSIANYFNITTNIKAKLKDDIIVMDTFFRNSYMQNKVNGIIKKNIHKLYKIDEPIIYNEQSNKIDYNLFLYCKNYENRIYKPYIFELHKKKRFYINVVKNIFQNEDLNTYETIYAHTKIDGLMSKNKIKTIAYPVRFGYWNNYVYQTKDNAFNIVKYPNYLKSTDDNISNKEYLINTLNRLNLNPAFVIFFLMRSLLIQGNYYQSDCIFLHNNILKTNFIKAFTNILGIFKETNDDFVIDRIINFDTLKAFKTAYDQSIKWNNIFLSDIPDNDNSLKMINSIVGKHEGNNILTYKDNITYTIPNTNITIFTGNDQYEINNILKTEYSIHNNSYYLLYYNIDNSNVSNFPYKYNWGIKKNAIMFKTIVKFCENAILKIRRGNLQYYTLDSLMEWININLKLDIDKNKFYVKISDVKEIKNKKSISNGNK